MICRFLLALAALIFFGCSTTPLNEAKKQEVDNIGVALLFEDSIPVAYVGTTIFNNEANRVNVANWNLNETISSEMESGLKSIGKKFKKINFDKNKIKQALEEGNTATKKMLGTTNDEVNEYLFSTAKSQGANYLFIFHPIKSDNFPHPKGFGLFCRSAFGSKGDWQAYTLFHVALWDLKTKEKVYQTAFDPEDIGFKSGKACDELKGTTPDKFAASFKDKFQLLAKKSAQMTLNKSGLVK